MGKLRVGVIGCGARGQNHALGYRQSDKVVLAACADTYPPAAEYMAHEYGFARRYTDYRQMLARERLDVVSMCLWPELHTEAVLACLEAPTLPRLINAEKPMAPTYGECVRMHEACQAAGVMLTFSHQRRFGLPFAKARELIAAGAIGTLQRLELDCPNLLDWGTHWFDMMLFYNNDLDPDWLIGQIGCVDDVLVYGARMETAGLTYVKWPNQVTGLLTTGQGTAAPVAIRAIGSQGMVDVDHVNVTLLREGQRRERVALPADHVPGGDTTRHMLDSIDCVLQGRESILCSRNALRATQLIFGTYESSRRRARVVLPLQIGDSPLLSMLKRRELRIPDWPAFLTDAEEGEGFELLFDGRTLRRWQSVPAAAWKVSGGILRGGYRQPGVLQTRRRYADVLLRCEFRLGSRGRAALVLRADAAGHGIEVALCDDRWEQRDTRSAGGLTGRVVPTADAGIGASNWNWLTVTLKGTALSVLINSRQTLACDLRDHPDLAALAAGPLALRAEQGPLDVRNVMVRRPG
jgi:UDP-N-acetylglucosamine 3-dehydrogenase